MATFTSEDLNRLEAESKRKQDRSDRRDKIISDRNNRSRLKESIKKKQAEKDLKLIGKSPSFTSEELDEIERQNNQGKILNTLENVSEVVDDFGGRFIESVTAAPFRAGISAAQNIVPSNEKETVLSNIARIPRDVVEAFGDEPDLSATGRDIVRKTSIFNEGSLGEAATGIAADIFFDPVTIAEGGFKLLKTIGKARQLRLIKQADKIEDLISTTKTIEDMTTVEKLELKAGQKAFDAIDSQIVNDSTVERIIREGRHTEKTLGKVVNDHNISLTNQEKALDQIRGPVAYETVTDPIRTDGVVPARHVSKAPSRSSGGVISNLSKDTTNLIKTVDIGNAKNINLWDEIRSPIFEKFVKGQLSKTSGIIHNKDDINKYRKVFRDLVIKQEVAGNKLKIDNVIDLKTGQPLSLGAETGKASTRSLTQLQELKRGIGRTLADKEFLNNPSELRIEKQVLLDVYRQINKVLAKHLKGQKVIRHGKEIDAGFEVAKNNKEVDALMEMTEILYSNIGSRNKGKDLAQQLVVLAGATGVGVGVAAKYGSPAMGFGVALSILGLKGQVSPKSLSRTSAIQARILNDLSKGAQSKILKTAKSVPVAAGRLTRANRSLLENRKNLNQVAPPTEFKEKRKRLRTRRRR